MFVSFHTLCCHSSGISGCCTGLSSCIILLLFCCKDSANRVKNQIYLSFSETQPIFGGVIPPKIRLFPQISKDHPLFCIVNNPSLSSNKGMLLGNKGSNNFLRLNDFYSAASPRNGPCSCQVARDRATGLCLYPKDLSSAPFDHKVRGICCQNTSIPRWPHAQQVRGLSSEEAVRASLLIPVRVVISRFLCLFQALASLVRCC